MSNHDPFTLDMLGGSQSALLSGLGLGVTAFANEPKSRTRGDRTCAGGEFIRFASARGVRETTGGRSARARQQLPSFPKPRLGKGLEGPRP